MRPESPAPRYSFAPRPSRRRAPGLETCEGRALCTLVFVFNGASFNATGPDRLTAGASAVIQKAGNRVVQLSNPRINSAGAFEALANRVVKLAHGQAVGLVGFSAGGALALRIATTPGLNVSSVLDYYGVPAVQDFLQARDVRPIAGLSPFRPSLVSLLSGPIEATAHVVAAYGQFDPNVGADVAGPDLLKDDPSADVYTYAGAHGVPITASPAALEDFLSHLS